MYSVEDWEVTSLFRGIIWEMRPWQWYKQSLILIGVVFSGRLFNLEAVIKTLLTVVAFSMVAGAIYIFNDINDLEQDRKHPTKRERPIASGLVPVPVAVVVGLAVGIGGLALGYIVRNLVFIILILYIFNNILYNMGLKNVMFVDVFSIAIGFVLRALSGVYAIQTNISLPSPWLIVCTLLAALLFALGKRYQELNLSEAEKTRPNLNYYDQEVIEHLLLVVISTLLMTYSLYTFTGTDQLMMLTLPFAYFATFRFYHLIHLNNDFQAIEKLVIFDRIFIGNLVLWAVSVLFTIYLKHIVWGYL